MLVTKKATRSASNYQKSLQMKGKNANKRITEILATNPSKKQARKEQVIMLLKRCETSKHIERILISKKARK